MINILIIGLGSIAKKHIIALKSINLEFEFFALRSNPEAIAQEGINNIYSLDDLPSVIDFALITNPTNLHSYYIRELANKRIPLFIEKPPLAQYDGAEKLNRIVIDSGVMTYVGCNLRFHPCIEFLQHFISTHSNQIINEVNVYCGSYLPDWRPGMDFRSIYSANEMMGGGVHLDLFHELDYVHWIFGPPTSIHSIKSNKSSLKISAVDYANYILAYKHFHATIILNYFRRDAKRSIEIVFQNETWTVDLINNFIFSSVNGNIFSAGSQFTMANTYKAQMQYFLNCLVHKSKPMNSFEESLKTLKICLVDG